MKQIIAVDADDTIFDENSAVRLFHNDKYGTQHTADDYLAPGVFGTFWEHIWKTDKPETLRRYEEFIDHKLEQNNLAPLEQALEVLKNLKKHYDLVIVTSRGAGAVDMTHQALAEHYPDIFTDVHFTPLWGGNEPATKAKICNDIGASYLIDDSYEHCVLAAEAGVQVLLFGHYGWNHYQELEANITRARDWGAVQEYFDGRG